MTKPAIPSIAGLPAPLQRVIAPMVDAIIKQSDQITTQSTQITTLEQLLRGSRATRPIVLEPGSLPPVANYRVVTAPNSITIYLNAIPNGAGGTATTQTPAYVTELWRAIGSNSADNAQIVQETVRFALEDHPPPGETYRYWLRYRSIDGTKTGPFTPANGILLVTQEAADPETLFDPTNGGVFLETFEGEDYPNRWIRRQGGGTTVDYQLSGVVGGKVVRIAGGEEWRVYDSRFEFDPSTLYRFKIGLRMSALPGNGATSARALLRAGFECYAADGTLIDTAGGTAYSLAHFFAAFDRDYGAAGVSVYQEFEGYLRGVGASPANNATDVANPSVARNGTRYFSPMFAVNYSGGNGTTEVDYIRIDALTPYSLSLSGGLSAPSVSLPADPSGVVSSYAAATGVFQLTLGLSSLDPANVAFSVGDNPQGLTATIDADGVYAVTSGFDAGESVAQVTFEADFSGITIPRVFTLTKSLQGTTGPPGGPGDAFTGYLTRVTWPILVQQDGTPISGAFSAANGRFYVFEAGVDVTASATFSFVATGCTGTINTDVNTPVASQPRGYYEVTAMSAEAGTLELTATYGGRNFNATFTVTKSRVGYEIVGTLPGSGNYVGRVVFLTTDSRLYRWTGSAWTAAVPASEITGQLTAAQIDTLTAAQITGTLVAAQIATITAPQITGTLTAAQIATITAAQVTGQLTAAQIASIAAAQITGTLSAAQIASITAAQITGQITGTQIADGSISTARLAAGSVTAAQIAAGTITAAQIAAGAITATQLAAGSVTAGALAAGSVTAGAIAAGSITTPALAAGAVTAANIAAGTIIAANIAAGAITGDRIAANSIATTNLQAGSITAVELAAGSVIAGKIAGNSITANEIAALTITAGQIAARTLTAEKIAVGAITANEIAANTITTNNIAAGQITTALLAAGAITTSRLAAGAVTANEIAAGSITGDRIAANTINGDRIIAGTITATSIAAGTITADRIVVGGLDTNTLAPGAVTNTVTDVLNTSTTYSPSPAAVVTRSVSITVIAGTRVQILFSATVSGLLGATLMWRLTLRRNGTPLQARGFVANPFQACYFIGMDSHPGAGTYTYDITIDKANGTAGSIEIYDMFLSATELRR